VRASYGMPEVTDLSLTMGKIPDHTWSSLIDQKERATGKAKQKMQLEVEVQSGNIHALMSFYSHPGMRHK